MSKQVVVLEDDAGYEQLLKNVLDGRGWVFRMGATYDEIAGSLDWGDVVVIDLDAAQGTACLARLREDGRAVPVVAISSDTTASAGALGVDAVVTTLPGGLCEAIRDVTAPPANVIDLTQQVDRGTGDRPWYATS